MIWLITGLIFWLFCGVLGSYLGYYVERNKYKVSIGADDYIFYVLMSLIGLANLISVCWIFKEELFGKTWRK